MRINFRNMKNVVDEAIISSRVANKTPPKKGKETQIKKKKQAEELVDRVFRKTGGGFGVSSN